MGVLDRIKQYQQQARTVMQQQDTQEPSTPERLPVGETSQQDSRSFLQQFLLKMLEENHIPVTALKFIPGFGQQIEKLLFGDPYEAHTFFADMHYQVQQILDKDKEHDPVEQARRREFAEAERRAKERREVPYVGATDTTTSGTFNDSWKDWIGQINSVGFVAEKIPRSLSDVEGLDSGLETEVQSSMVDGRSECDEAL